MSLHRKIDLIHIGQSGTSESALLCHGRSQRLQSTAVLTLMAHANQVSDEEDEDDDNNNEASDDDVEFIDIDTLDFDELVGP
jgi:uncharacterized metal-binding protein YceD (DUF177 family)